MTYIPYPERRRLNTPPDVLAAQEEREVRFQRIEQLQELSSAQRHQMLGQFLLTLSRRKETISEQHRYIEIIRETSRDETRTDEIIEHYGELYCLDRMVEGFALDVDYRKEWTRPREYERGGGDGLGFYHPHRPRNLLVTFEGRMWSTSMSAYVFETEEPNIVQVSREGETMSVVAKREELVEAAIVAGIEAMAQPRG